MNNKEANRLELETGCKPIEFDGVDGLFAFFEPGYKKHIVIAGECGKTKVNAKQVLALADGLREIAETYMEVPA